MTDFDPAQFQAEMLSHIDSTFDQAEADFARRVLGDEPAIETPPEPESEVPSVPEAYDLNHVLSAFERGELTQDQLRFVADQEVARRAAEPRPLSVAELRAKQEQAAREALLADPDAAEWMKKAEAGLARLRGR